MARRAPAFTLIELLVVIAIIALLIAILLPALAAARLQARATACSGRLQQLAIALAAYNNDFDNYLPQAKGKDFSGMDVVIGALFGGKKGELPFYSINEIGAEGRPLNRYVDSSRDIQPDSEPGVVPMPQFQSPADRGAEATGIPGFDRTDSMYDLIGASYTLNDHDLRGEDKATLVPLGGGRTPEVQDTTKTWVLGTHTIYNYQQDGDRGMWWFSPKQVEANLLFVDGHCRVRVPVPQGVENTTPDYTFLPVP